MKMSRELDPGSTEVVRIESEGEMESVVSGPFEEKDVDEGEFPLYFECACFCSVLLTLSSCVVSGGGVLRKPRSRGSSSDSESSDEERVSARKRSRSASVSRVSARERSRSASVSLVTEIPKGAVSRDIARGSEIGRERIAKGGEFYLVFFERRE